MSNPSLTIAILGATGGMGRSFVDQALRAGDQLRALVRHPPSPALPRPLQVIPGTVDDLEAIRKTIEGSSVVVSCLGAKLSHSFGRSGLVGTAGMRNATKAMQPAGVRRLVAVSAFGAADSYRQTSLLFRLVMSTVLRGIYADKNAMEPIIRASQLDWTIVRPTNLTSHPATGNIAINPAGKLGLGNTITRSDAAAFLLRVAAGEEFVGEAPVISNC